ncbi:phage integrase central domain-containing protein [Novosphingobium sp. Rr 2-17]|uniref:phage integrase central domain-containing protein n=1 Tax=Novosphingobium sp. Rr 2-17 TaxID=555793 RepID=UPI003FCF2B50
MAGEWVAKNEREGMAEITLSKLRWLLDKAYPRIGNRPVAKITAQEVLTVLRAIEATGRHESARRMRSVLSRVFRYAIATGLVTVLCRSPISLSHLGFEREWADAAQI